MANQAPPPPTRPWFGLGAQARRTFTPATAAPAPSPVAPQAQPIRPPVIRNSFLPAFRPPSTITTTTAPPQPRTPARPPSPTVAQPPLQTSRPTLSPSSSTTITTTTSKSPSTPLQATGLVSPLAANAKSPSTPPQATRFTSPLAANAKSPSTPPQATRLTSPLAANAKSSPPPPPSFSRPVHSSPAKPVTPLSPNPGTSPFSAAAAKLNSSTPITTSPVQPSPRRSPPPVVYNNNGISQSNNSPLKSSSNSTPPPATVTAASLAARNGTGSPTAASAKPTTTKTSSNLMTASRSPPTHPNATMAADSNRYATPPPKPSNASPPSPFALSPPQLNYPTTEEEPKRVLNEVRTTTTTHAKPMVFRNATRAVEPSANVYQEKNLTNDEKSKKTYNKWFKMHSDHSEDGSHGGGARSITIAGENKGAVMEVGYPPWKRNNKYQTSSNNPQGNAYYYNNSGHNNVHPKGGNGDSTANNSNVAGRGEGDQHYQHQLPHWNGGGAYMNSNVQGINNSILFNSSYTDHDPGLHFFSRKPAGSHYNGRGGIRSSNYQNKGQHDNNGNH